MLESSPGPQEGARGSLKAKLVSLTLNTKWFAPLFCAICFGLFGGIAMVWGLMVNISHRPIADLPLYPGAQAIVDQDGKTVTVLDTSTISRSQTSVSFNFETVDPPDQVAAFYKDSLEHTYGFIAPTVEVSADGTYIVKGIRTARRDTLTTETVTVNIVPVTTLLTKVALGLMVRW